MCGCDPRRLRPVDGRSCIERRPGHRLRAVARRCCIERVNGCHPPSAIGHRAGDGADGTGVLVGGQTAVTVDFLDQTDQYTPIVFAVVLGLSFILLTVAFRSIVIPGKAIAMNLLSVAAAYGLVVAFFQTAAGPEWVKDIAGWLEFTQVETIEA